MSDRLQTLDDREVVRLVAAANAAAGLALLSLAWMGETRLAVVTLLATVVLGALSAVGTLCAAGAKVAHQLQSGLERRQRLAARVEDRRAGTLSLAEAPSGALSPSSSRSRR